MPERFVPEEKFYLKFGNLKIMSKIGKKIINIPSGVKVDIKDGNIVFSGNNGVLYVNILSGITPKLESESLVFEALSSDKQTRSNWGTMRALSANALDGASKDFVKELKIEGVGYKVNIEGDTVIFNIGYSHPVKFKIPAGIKVSVEKNIVKITGADKQLVGEIAANMRAIRKPEPYKGKGIMYVGEIIRRKEGKKVAGSGSK